VADIAEGGRLPEQATIGAVAGLRDETLVRAPHGGTVVEWLVSDGDPVSPGQPLIRLHPEAVGG
jgi:[acyl-carrier-protein] S-malonyltransferase